MAPPTPLAEAASSAAGLRAADLAKALEVPALSRAELEKRAQALREQCFPGLLSQVCPFPSPFSSGLPSPLSALRPPSSLAFR